MRHVALTIRSGDLDEVLDRLLPLVAQGVHEHPAGEGRLELGIYGPSPGTDALRSAAGAALLELEESEADDDAERRRLQAFARRPAIGGRVVVRPERAPAPAEGLLDLVIEGPRGAVGAGSHPTTEMCIELLLGLEPGGAFADLGCGTGVLAILAARLGWAPAIALDHEPAAVEAARANVRRNGVEVEVLAADLLAAPPPPVPTLSANVPLDVHAAIAGRLAPETRRVIVSGMVDEHLPQVASAYERAGFAPAARAVRRSWAAALLVRDG